MSEDDNAATLPAGTPIPSAGQSVDRLPPPPSAPKSARTNSTVDLGERYDLKDVIGRGGMGEVRLARDSRIDRDVAVKLMHAGQRDDTTVARFFREARVQGGLEHPAVVPVHDLGIDVDGNPYFVMKRLAGTTLHAVLSKHLVTDEDRNAEKMIGRETPMPREVRWSRRQLLTHLVDVCLAIEFAHKHGVVHRDIKPANIMLGEYGEAYVLDWGLAKIIGDTAFRAVQPLSGGDAGATVAGELLGTPGFMSPEQARGEDVDARTDVFALGCILFEILTDKPALPSGLGSLAVTLSIEKDLRPTDRVPSTDIAPELDDICARATNAERDQRPTARELAEKIQAYLDGDRDHARRRELATEYAQRAKAALDAPGAGASDDARATAMREGGRALALDPGNTVAQLVLGGLLLERRGEAIPAGALADAEAERDRSRQQIAQYAAMGYLGMAAIAPILFVFETHAVWPIIAVIVAALAAAASAYIGSRKLVVIKTPWFPIVLSLNLGLLALIGIIFGPLFLLQVFITGSLAAWLIQPLPYPPWVLAVAHAMTIVPILALEYLEVLPSTYHIEGTRLVLTPWVLDITPTMTVVVWAIGLGVQTASSLNIMVSFKRNQIDAQNRVHAQRWHLKQLLPRPGDEPPDERPTRPGEDPPPTPASRRA